MRNLIAATAVLVVAFWSPGIAADDAADIAAVEQEIAAEDEAAAFVKRARKRAEKAVRASSIGQYAEQHRLATIAANEALKTSTAYRQYLGEEQLGEFRCVNCSSDVYLEKSHAHNEERFARMRRYEDVRKELRLDELADESAILHNRIRRLIDKMTDRFIEDEINKAIEQDLRALERELRRRRPPLEGVHDA